MFYLSSSFLLATALALGISAETALAQEDEAASFAVDEAYAQGTDAIAQSIESDAAEENAEFWERYLGHYKFRKKNMKMSMPPTPESCNVRVEIGCKTTDGVECMDITPINPENAICSNGGPIDVITLRYTNCLCEDSTNRQGSAFTCEDHAPLGFVEDITVTCTDARSGAEMTVDEDSIAPDGTFSVTNPPGRPLPDRLNCVLFSQDGEKLQTVEFDTSGSVDLKLKDKFGALEVESCDEQDCIVTVCYNYDLFNIGSSEMDITQVLRIFNGDEEDLLGLVPINPLAPGQSTGIEEKIDIDICTEGEFRTDIFVEADPPAGGTCFDNATYEFTIQPPPPTPTPPPPTPTPPPPTPPPPTPPPPTPPPPTPPPTNKACKVEVEIGCKTTEGVQCVDIPPVTPGSAICSNGGPIDVVTFRYTNCLCEDSTNRQGSAFTCEDFAPLGFVDDITVTCTDASNGDPMTVDEDSIAPDGTFSVTNPSGGPLPDSLSCTLFAQDGEKLQTVEFDTSGSVDLSLRDKFGALQLESCDEQTCLETVCYNYDISNVGSDVMDITEVLRIFNGFEENLLGLVPINPLDPGQSTSVEEKFIIDLCSPGEYRTDIFVEADPPNGSTCFANDTYSFTIEPPPPPTPPPTETCSIDVGINCTLSGGVPCDVPTPGVTQCEGRPLMVGMLYNGGDCSQSDNSQDDGKFSCADFNGGPPTEENAESYIIVTDQKGQGIVYFEGFASVGSIYTLSDNGNRFVADQTITIYSSDVTTQDNLLQLVDYHSSCSQNLDLKNRFGASQIVEWFNEEQGLVTCFANISYGLVINIPLTITGDSLTMETLVIRTNFDGTKNLTDDVAGLVVPAGGQVEVTFDVNLNLAEKARYTFLTTLTGRTDTGILCEGVSFDSFLIGYPDTVTDTFPTISPGGRRAA